MNTKNMLVLAVLLALTGSIGAGERSHKYMGAKKEPIGEKVKKIKIVKGVPKTKYFHSTKKNIRWEILEKNKVPKGLQVTLDTYEPKKVLKNRKGNELFSHAKLTLLSHELGAVYPLTLQKTFVGTDKKPKIRHYNVKVVKSMDTEKMKKAGKKEAKKTGKFETSKTSTPVTKTEALKDIARRFIEGKS